jgi:hypothetical protein
VGQEQESDYKKRTPENTRSGKKTVRPFTIINSFNKASAFDAGSVWVKEQDSIKATAQNRERFGYLYVEIIIIIIRKR